MVGIRRFFPLLAVAFFFDLSGWAKQATFLDVSPFGETALQKDDSLSRQGIVQILRIEGLLADSLFEADGFAPKSGAVLVRETKLKEYGKIYQVQVNQKYLGKNLPGEPDQFIPAFVIKYYFNPEHDETQLLALVRKSELARFPMGDSDYPRLCLYETSHSYRGKTGSHCFMIQHSAKGRMIQDYLLELLASLGNLKSAVSPLFAVTERAFRKSGKALAKVHLRFETHPEGAFVDMKTVIHGDYHSENVFFDSNTGRIYLIDNVDFGTSLLNPGGDDFRGDVKDFISYVSEQENEANLEVMMSLYESFIEGYVSAFPPLRQVEVRKELQILVSAFRVRSLVTK